MVFGAPAISPTNAVSPLTTGPLASLDLSHLRRSNKALDALMAGNPGLAKFLENNANSICVPAPGDVQTEFRWSMWTHSPRSDGSLTQANEKDTIVVWQEVPSSSARVNFGGNSFPGQIIAIHQVDQRDGRQISHSPASDNGYLWEAMRVVASGARGAPCVLHYAVVTLNAAGAATSGGYPGGWAGRNHNGQHGQGSHIWLAA